MWILAAHMKNGSAIFHMQHTDEVVPDHFKVAESKPCAIFESNGDR